MLVTLIGYRKLGGRSAVEVRSFSILLHRDHFHFGADYLANRVRETLPENAIPLRFAAIKNEGDALSCEIECILSGSVPDKSAHSSSPMDIFSFRKRKFERSEKFIAAMVIPTGIDCQIGGHAGDAAPSAKLLSKICDRIVLHPNVVNASNLNDQPENALYVEGSVLSSVLMGSQSLREVRSNRVLVISEPDDRMALNHAINSAGAALSALGVDCIEVAVLPEKLNMMIEYSDSGRATGRVSNLDDVIRYLDQRRAEFDAVAIASRITPPVDSVELHREYFSGNGPNPWGGVEAILTHALSALLSLPTAHAPTLSDPSLASVDFGVVDPRMAAEAISITYLMCVLKGLSNAPQIGVGNSDYEPGTVNAEDISAVIVPAGAMGIPVLAALWQGIKVIEVIGNKTLSSCDLSSLPWLPNQFYRVGTYCEAAGLLLAIKEGISPASLARPLPRARTSRVMDLAQTEAAD